MWLAMMASRQLRTQNNKWCGALSVPIGLAARCKERFKAGERGGGVGHLQYWMQRPKGQMVSILPWQIFLLRKWQTISEGTCLNQTFCWALKDSWHSSCRFFCNPDVRLYPKKTFVCPRSSQSRLKTKSLLYKSHVLLKSSNTLTISTNKMNQNDMSDMWHVILMYLFVLMWCWKSFNFNKTQHLF